MGWSVANTLIFTLLGYAAFELLVPHTYLMAFIEAGNSLKPIRRFAPIIGAMMLMLVPYLPSALRTLYLGVCAGVLATWSNDFGYFSAVFLGLYFLYQYFTSTISLKQCVLHGLGFFAIACVAYLAIIYNVTGGYPLEWLAYNFQGVGENQWWYYKPYTRKIFYWYEVNKIFTREFSKAGLGRLILMVGISVSALLIPVLMWLAVRRRQFSLLIYSYVGLTLFSGAFISEYLGHMSDGYWYGILPWVALSLLCFLRLPQLPSYITTWLAVLLLAHMSVQWFDRYRVVENTEAKLEQTHKYRKELGSYLSINYEDYAGFLRHMMYEYAIVVEEYSSLASVVLGKSPPVPFDSVIHALGKKNQMRYLEALKTSKPDYITTTNPAYSHWQAWSLNQNWWFYRYLFRHYQVVQTFPSQYIWQRKEEVGNIDELSDITCEVEGKHLKLIAEEEPDKAKLLSVTLDYTLHDTHKIIVLVHNNLMERHDAVSLNTTRPSNHVSFPVFMNKKHVFLKSKILPLEKESALELVHCNVAEIEGESVAYYREHYVKKEE